MPFYIDVIIPVPIEKLFTYAVSEMEANFLKRGMRVAVPFGKSKIYTGLVNAIHQNKLVTYDPKEIHQILDEYPVVTGTQLRHWFWIANYYMCTIGDVYRAAMPKTFLLESETQILKNEVAEIDDNDLKDDEFLVVEALEHQSSLSVQEISSIVDKKNTLPLLKRLLEKDLIRIKEEIYEKYKPKLVNYIRLNELYEDDSNLEDLLNQLKRAPKQQQVILSFFNLRSGGKPIKEKDLAEASGVSVTIIKSLVKKDILELYTLQVDRLQAIEGKGQPLNALNQYQLAAYDDIKEGFSTEKVSLLHGVTSSGKTEVYFKLIEETIKLGKQVLYLLPEIALTTQLITRLQQFFPEYVSVFHSKYNLNERTEVWNNVLKNNDKARIIIGARSSIFLPFQNLGLIVVDEEHDNSFKQFDPAPRYHARDAAIVLANIHKSNVLLGSATPSLESYLNAKNGKYAYAYIKRRHANVLMPDIELVDLKDKMKRKRMTGHFSDRLLEEINETLAEKKQIILFQNRRGYAPVMECTTCGHSPQCPNCDVTLTYHQHRNQLRCHYCGHHMAVPKQCHACGSSTIDTKGFGTEQIQEELENLFPEHAIGRMDLDTTRGKYGYQKIISKFQNHEIDILVGTQMVTKGLDFRNVKLVGILNADNLLHFPDYKSHERCYQLLVQVSGRAGRTNERGKVLIQTYNPYHQILKQVSTNSYEEMFNEQLYERQQFQYPPYNRILKITLKHRDYNTLNKASDWLADSLRMTFKQGVLGPESPAISRIRNLYIKNIIVKFSKRAPIKENKHKIKRIQSSFESISIFKGVRILYHVDHI